MSVSPISRTMTMRKETLDQSERREMRAFVEVDADAAAHAGDHGFETLFKVGDEIGGYQAMRLDRRPGPQERPIWS